MAAKLTDAEMAVIGPALARYRALKPRTGSTAEASVLAKPAAHWDAIAASADKSAGFLRAHEKTAVSPEAYRKGIAQAEQTASGARRMAERARAAGGTLGGPADVIAKRIAEVRAQRKAGPDSRAASAVPGSYVPGSARKPDDDGPAVEAHDTTGEKVRVFETRGNVAVTDKGPRHTTKLFPEGKGGKSMASMGYAEGQHDMTRESRRSGGGLRDWNEADHPRDEGGKFTNK